MSTMIEANANKLRELILGNTQFVIKIRTIDSSLFFLSMPQEQLMQLHDKLSAHNDGVKLYMLDIDKLPICVISA